MLSPWAAATTELKVQLSGWYCHCLSNRDVGVWWHDGTPALSSSVTLASTDALPRLRPTRAVRTAAHALPSALLNSLYNEWPGNRGVAGHLGKSATLARRDKFPPRYAFGIGTARQAPPVHRLRTDAHTIREALKTSTLANALVNQLQVRPHLLPPVARYAAANGEDTNVFCGRTLSV